MHSMEEAMKSVRTVEVTKAVRDTKINSLRIKEGQAIGILDDEDIVVADNTVSVALLDALNKADIKSAEVVTIYQGADVNGDETEKIIEEINNKYPGKQIETVQGGQPYYNYIVSLE